MLLFAGDIAIVVVAAWLGATVVVRTPRDYVARLFGATMALAALWSGARLVWRLTSSAEVQQACGRLEIVLAELAPAVLLHFALAYAGGRRWTAVQRGLLGLAYVAGAGVGFYAVIEPTRPISISDPERFLGPELGLAIGWGWIGLRALALGGALWWTWRAWLRTEAQSDRAQQLSRVLGALSAAAAGILCLIFSYQVGLLEWVGLALLILSLGLATYAVFAGGVFVAPRAARRSFWLSVGTGGLTAGYVFGLLALDRLVRRLLSIDAALITPLALVLTIALFDPIRDRLRALLDWFAGRRDLPYRRLLNAFGDELFTAQAPEEAVAPALAQLCRAVGIRSAAVLAPDGTLIAGYGPQEGLEANAPLSLPLATGERVLGKAVFGPKRARLPYSPGDLDLLSHAGTFIVTALRLAERQQAQALALETLAEERAAFQVQEATLAAALETVAAAPEAVADALPTGLRVYALGPLRVERDGQAIRQWGGAKAGSRQAEAIFAFLLDRGERGATKDEFLEVIWPDVLIDKGDLAFHRTLGGLRRTLDPAAQRGSDSTLITYHNDRYRLDPNLVVWSDVAEFERQIAAADTEDSQVALAALDAARALYRGDYLDDCPFYGDSEYVEERRTVLRGRYVDLLLALGERHEARGNPTAAAACYREARQVSGDDCPRADRGLARLGVVA